MKSTLRSSAWFLMAMLTNGPVAGCLDFTPITRVPTEGGEADASGPEGSPIESACLGCANRGGDAGGCAGEFTTCDLFPECKATVQCVLGTCFDPNANIGQCLTVCEQDGGISASQGPPNAAFAAFLQCMSTHCQSVCLP
jgi:hypothetical protein